jgi:hypothetical protein
MNPETHIAKKLWALYIDDGAGAWSHLGTYVRLRGAIYQGRSALLGGTRSIKIVPHFREIPRRRRRSPLSKPQT